LTLFNVGFMMNSVPAQTGMSLPVATPVKPEDFAILPWGMTESDDPEVYAGIAECGFNMAGFVNAKRLDLAHKAGLKAFLHDGSLHGAGDNLKLPTAEIEQRVAKALDPVKSHPAFFGVYLRDEPNADAFPGLARWSDAVLKAKPDCRPYINLFPDYGPIPDYEAHVTSFTEIVRPKFVSYDHYALFANGTLRDSYFLNLEVVRKVAMKAGVPFWNIVLGNAHFDYAEPSPAGLRFQMYTTLAYGARGISYFTYFAPAIGNYRLAPLDQFHHKTPTWDMLRNVNLQLHQLAPEYLKLTSLGVVHHPEVPKGCHPLSESRFVKTVGEGKFAIGEFENADKKPAILVVNRNLRGSVAFSFEWKFKPKSPTKMLSPYTGKWQTWAGENNWLAPGQGMILTAEPGDESK
jgi:hypothetical protein